MSRAQTRSNLRPVEPHRLQMPSHLQDHTILDVGEGSCSRRMPAHEQNVCASSSCPSTSPHAFPMRTAVRHDCKAREIMPSRCRTCERDDVLCTSFYSNMDSERRDRDTNTRGTSLCTSRRAIEPTRCHPFALSCLTNWHFRFEHIHLPCSLIVPHFVASSS